MGPLFGRMLLGLVELLAGILVAVIWRVGHPVIVEHMGAETLTPRPPSSFVW